MNTLISWHTTVFGRVESVAPAVLTTLARLIFAATLVGYYWASAMTKVGDGLFSPSVGAYAQVFPKRAEALLYDVSQFSWLETMIVLLGTWAEFVLPALIVVGLLTRLASLGMIGFIVVQSVVDIVGHGADATTVGAWFDRFSGALILDQRAFWVFLLMVLIFRGAGPVSLDKILGSRLTLGLRTERLP